MKIQDIARDEGRREDIEVFRSVIDRDAARDARQAFNVLDATSVARARLAVSQRAVVFLR